MIKELYVGDKLKIRGFRITITSIDKVNDRMYYDHDNNVSGENASLSVTLRNKDIIWDYTYQHRRKKILEQL